MTAPNFRTYTDADFLRWAEAEHDALVASTVETELLRRFASLVDRAEVGDELADVCGDHGLDTPEALTKELERIRRFDALMDDLTQPLKDLAELAPN